MKLTYGEAIQFLCDLRFFGLEFGLETTLHLAELAGNPQSRLQFIHVAGTNGKGSTCAMLESIYRTAGLRVGLFTSPHLVAFGERIQVNRQFIPEHEVVRLIEQTKGWLPLLPDGAQPTFFEVVTVMALTYFWEQQCHLVIWETGMGGRLDATNIVTPLAAVITNVQLDHQAWLGGTLSQIAGEKAGIIKPGVPVLTGTDAPEVLTVIAQVARTLRAPLTVVEPEESWRPPLDAIRLPLLGEHQRANAALALATVHALQPLLPVSEDAIRAGLESVSWPGRFQVVRRSPEQTFVLDGAHNPEGAKTLREALRERFPGAHPTLVLGMMRDKDWEEMCRVLAPGAGRLLFAPVESERAAAPVELAAFCRALNPAAEVIACASLRDAFEQARRDSLVVVAGSLHFVGQAMELLEIGPPTRGDERALNEWGGQRNPLDPSHPAKRRPQPGT